MQQYAAAMETMAANVIEMAEIIIMAAPPPSHAGGGDEVANRARSEKKDAVVCFLLVDAVDQGAGADDGRDVRHPVLSPPCSHPLGTP